LPRSTNPVGLDQDLFAAVQVKLAANAVARKVRLRGSVSILTGRIYDDRGNRMSPTHSNKLGVRYRYYVSHALLQNRKEAAGSVTRVPAPEIEQLVLDGLRGRLQSAKPSAAAVDRDLIERHIDRVIVRPQAVEVRLLSAGSTELSGGDELIPCELTTTALTLPWARCTCIGSLPSGRTSGDTQFETACPPAHSRQSDRRGMSAQCPNHGRLSAVPLG
jgi:hypothetical protein